MLFLLKFETFIITMILYPTPDKNARKNKVTQTKTKL